MNEDQLTHLLSKFLFDNAKNCTERVVFDSALNVLIGVHSTIRECDAEQSAMEIAQVLLDAGFEEQEPLKR